MIKDSEDLDIIQFRRDVANECMCIFAAKLKDYGPTWLLFRDVSFADQLWIKIKRIRNIEETGVNKVGDSLENEFLGIINYSVIMLLKIKYKNEIISCDEFIEKENVEIDQILISEYYKSVWNEINQLFEKKNYDYGNAWAEMHPHSITDQIIIKIRRIKNIMENGGKLLVSEGIDAQLMDIINYSIFGLKMLQKLL